jgi:hypothetical protein
VFGDDYGLPPGDYGLVEMYCDDQNCDCRRVLLNVMASFSKKCEAVIAFGWESELFYARWYNLDNNLTKEQYDKQFNETDKYAIKTLKGPCLNMASHQGKYAEIILDIVNEKVLNDELYVDRLKRHYQIFKNEVDKFSS